MQHGRSAPLVFFKRTILTSTPFNRIFELTSILMVLTLALLSANAEARELQGRLGVGYNSEFAEGSVPSLSMKYALARDIGTELIIGVNTRAPASTVVGFKLSKGLFLETNLNFNAFAGAGMVSHQAVSGFEMLAGFGLEFFIPGLESVGFSTDTGVSLGTSTGAFALRTLGVSFLNAGIHFYF